jgi:hypothetical protein
MGTEDGAERCVRVYLDEHRSRQWGGRGSKGHPLGVAVDYCHV